MVRHTSWLVAGVLLLAAALISLVRVVRGPSSLDRSIAADVIVAVVVAATGMTVVVRAQDSLMAVLVVVSLLAFTGPVALARLIGSRSALVARPEDGQDPSETGQGTSGPQTDGGEDA